jgi:hypothetical protein
LPCNTKENGPLASARGHQAHQELEEIDENEESQRF